MKNFSTGFSELDKQLDRGLPESSLTIITYSLSIGEISLWLSIAMYLALKKHIPVAIFSRNLSKRELAKQIISNKLEMDASKFNTYVLQPESLKELADTMEVMANAPIYVDYSKSTTIIDIQRKARELIKSCEKLGAIIIEDLQLISNNNSGKYNYFESPKVILQGLRNLSRELKIPIVVNSSLFCNEENSESHRHELIHFI